MFDHMTIESRSNNRILFQTHIDNLLRALRVAERANRTVIRLSKSNGQPYLSFDIFLATMESHLDVPVIIQHSQMFHMCQRPEVEQKQDKPMLKFKLPEIRTLRTIVDRMSGVG